MKSLRHVSRRPGRRRVSERIARKIKGQISARRLRPGEKLPAEREMAQRCKTSRVSVREAYRSLEEMGLLTIRRGAEGGAFVADVDHGPIRRSLALMLHLGKTTHEEITEARLLIEPPIARLAARRARPEDVERLQDVVRRQEDALDRRGDYSPFDLQFHRSVAACARNLPLKVLMDSLSDLTVEVVAALDLSRGVQHQVCEHHRRIADAIQRQDEDAAFRLMLHHVADVQARLGRTLAASAKARASLDAAMRRQAQQRRAASRGPQRRAPRAAAARGTERGSRVGVEKIGGGDRQSGVGAPRVKEVTEPRGA